MEQIAALLAAGHVFIEDETYVGIASDGTRVLLGNVGMEDRMAAYLADHPTPDTW